MGLSRWMYVCNDLASWSREKELGAETWYISWSRPDNVCKKNLPSQASSSWRTEASKAEDRKNDQNFFFS